MLLVASQVATHQKTQQGLKHLGTEALKAPNPAVATHQKTQQGLKHYYNARMLMENASRNASENPAGIETYEHPQDRRIDFVATHQKTQQGLKLETQKWALVEEMVATHQKTQQGLKHGHVVGVRALKSQRIRKPSRD